MSQRTDPFDWSGGHPALDLVNTLDERLSSAPIERLVTYGDLVCFAKQAGMVDASISSRLRGLSGPKCQRIASRVRHLREHLHAILAAAWSDGILPSDALNAISKAVCDAHAARSLAPAESTGLVSFKWTAAADPAIPLHACALAVENLLIEANRDRIRKCDASDCDVYFIDTSKAHRRQWCSMQNCGNREKQRRWRSGAEK
jgi:predicted RNA-binding Zn ribbon-like protein